MPRNLDANNNPIALNAAQTAARYWKDTHGNARHFVAVRTAQDVIRELHYKCCSILHAKCLRDCKTLVVSGVAPAPTDDFIVWIAADTTFAGGPDGTAAWLASKIGGSSLPFINEFGTIDFLTDITLGSDKAQYTADAMKFLDRFSLELDNRLPEGSEAATAVRRAEELADKRIKDCEAGVAQTKELLKEERKMVARLEKVITAAGIALPRQCACGEIYAPETQVETREYAPRVVKVLDEEKGEVIEEAETAGGKVNLYRPTWHSHWNGREEDEEVVCHKCIFGKPENCSPCFVPQPTKVEFIASKMYGKAYEYSPPQCLCCMNGLDKRNCFVWNKNRYLLVPQFATAI